MNFKEWSERYYPNECAEVLHKMSHAWAAGHINMDCCSIKTCDHEWEELKSKKGPTGWEWCKNCGLLRTWTGNEWEYV